MTMNLLRKATLCCVFLAILGPVLVHLHPMTALTARVRRPSGILSLEPTEAIVFPGDNITYICSHTSNVTFQWDFSSEVRSHEIVHGSYLLDGTDQDIFYSQINIYSTTRRMSGEITCTAKEQQGLRAIGFLIVNGVRNGGACRVSSDCMTDKATCQDGICECPRNYVRLRVKDRGFDVCREMIYSLYDPCEYDEQCTHLVDPKSVCKDVCVCAPWARDRRGKCVAISEISYNKSQEMYRVGLIAVTCIIILIVAVSLWVTLKRSCHEQNTDGQRRSITLNDASLANRLSIDITSDKPPSYDDIQITGGMVETPPNIKDALKHSMTAKRLLRQVSAPAGQLLSQPTVEFLKKSDREFHDK